MTTVLRRARRKRKALPKDSLTTFLRHPDRARAPCRYYLVEFDQGILKPGITSNFRSRCRRAAKAGHPYGRPLFLSKNYPRSWVWVAEQIILSETRSHRCTVLPLALKGYPGTTEFRKATLAPELIIDRFIDLIEQIKELGFQQVALDAFN